MTDTKQKILDTAERLFGEQGYSAVSVRHIIAEAGVNLAAIHYHFGSKEDLLVELVGRKVGPVNDDRLALLSGFEEEYGPDRVPVEKVLEAFLLPAFLKARNNPQFVRLMGRLHAEGLIIVLFKKHFESLFNRFFAALRAALPHLPDEELAWRVHFMIGAMAHALVGPPQALPNAGDDPRKVAQRLIDFLAGGLRAGVSHPATAEVRS